MKATAASKTWRGGRADMRTSSAAKAMNSAASEAGRGGRANVGNSVAGMKTTAAKAVQSPADKTCGTGRGARV
jgi:hypothetical protein